MSKTNKIKKIIIMIISLELIFLSYWNFKNHPFQFVYFNPIFKSFTKNNFDLDYWGISNKHILEKTYEINKQKPLKITTKSFTNLNDSFRILDENLKDKITIVYDIKDADYVIDNHMKRWSNVPGQETLKDKFKVVYNLVIDDNVVSTIYKRTNK